MIIFSLDALADDSDRRHLIDRDSILYKCVHHPLKPCDDCKKKHRDWKCDYPAYYEACDKDAPIEPVMEIFNRIGEGFTVEIWSDRSEEFREKTEKWFSEYFCGFSFVTIKLRPISDDRPQEELFEEWLNEFVNSNEWCRIAVTQRKCPLDFVFSSHGPTIDMFRARGIFTFDTCQGK